MKQKHLKLMLQLIGCSQLCNECGGIRGRGCFNAKNITLEEYDGKNLTFDECRNKCKTNEVTCSGFGFGVMGRRRSGDCILFKEGCQQDENLNWDYYSMDQCKGQILVFPWDSQRKCFET